MCLNCMNHFNQASLMPLNLGQLLMICCGPPECWPIYSEPLDLADPPASAPLHSSLVMWWLQSRCVCCGRVLLVPKLQVSISTTALCCLPVTREGCLSALLQGKDCKNAPGQCGWKHCIRGLPYDSSRPARVGTHLCTARNYWLLQDRAGISHFIIFVPKISLSRGALLQLWY